MFSNTLPATVLCTNQLWRKISMKADRPQKFIQFTLVTINLFTKTVKSVLKCVTFIR